jgi:hypothetical protein
VQISVPFLNTAAAAGGSGTVIAKRDTKALVLTCRHVVEDETKNGTLLRKDRKNCKVRFPGGKVVSGPVVAIDDAADLAAIEVDASEKDAKGGEMPCTAIGELPLVANDKVACFGYGPAAAMNPKPMHRVGVCRGVGGKVNGQFGTYQSVDLAMYGHSGDSGAGIFRESSGYLVGVLWGGEGEVASNVSKIVPLESIDRFAQKWCKDWFPPKGKGPAISQVPPAAGPGTPPASTPQAPVTLKGDKGDTGATGATGAKGEPGTPADESKLTRALDIAEKVEPIAQVGVPLVLTALGVSMTGPIGWGIAGIGALLRLRRRLRGPATPQAPPTAGTPPAPFPTPIVTPTPNGGTQPDAGLSGRLSQIEKALALLLNRPTEAKPAAPAQPFPEDLSPIERDTREGLELLRLQQLEGRDPLQDAIAGRLIWNRLDALAEGKGDPAHAKWADDLRREIHQRYNEIAPTKFQPEVRK